jgi:hypothetical protein
MLNPYFKNDGGCLSSFIISIFTFYFDNTMFSPFSVMGCSLELLKFGDCGIVTVCQSHVCSISLVVLITFLIIPRLLIHLLINHLC